MVPIDQGPFQCLVLLVKGSHYKDKPALRPSYFMIEIRIHGKKVFMLKRYHSSRKNTPISALEWYTYCCVSKWLSTDARVGHVIHLSVVGGAMDELTGLVGRGILVEVTAGIQEAVCLAGTRSRNAAVYSSDLRKKKWYGRE